MKASRNRSAAFRTRSTKCAPAWNCGIRIEGYSEFQVGDTIEMLLDGKVAAKL